MQRAFGLDIPQTLDEVCNFTRLALVVYDMQVGIVKQIENGQQITDKVAQVLAAARKAGIRVFFTRHMSLPKELMGMSQFRTAMAWQRVKSPDEVKPWFLRDAPGFHLITEMNPLPSEAIFDKITMSAFEGTPLDIALRDCDIDAFAIVGIAMEIGIEPTVRQGADLGYIPIVVKDACGFGHRDAAERSIASLEFAGDALAYERRYIPCSAWAQPLRVSGSRRAARLARYKVLPFRREKAAHGPTPPGKDQTPYRFDGLNHGDSPAIVRSRSQSTRRAVAFFNSGCE